MGALLYAAEISAVARDGAVTLTGTVDSYAKKLEAEEAAKKVAGVKAVTDDVKVIIGKSARKTDAEIAIDAARIINGSLVIPRHATL